LAATEKPTVYVLAGPNGAGKTSFAKSYLPHFAGCREFVNADLIASGLSPFNPESQSIVAGRLMLQRIDELIQASESFAFETTLAGRTHARRLRMMKEELGYEIELIYLWLPSADFAAKRVEIRVSQGGHNIPEATIRRRYKLGISNFAKLYSPLANRWLIIDGSWSPSLPIVGFENGQLTVYNEKMFAELKLRTDGLMS
jgi:predicted ABC-type ATPase